MHRFRWHIRPILAILFIYIAIPSQGQTLTLYDAVNKSITTYPLLQQRQAEVAASKAHISTINGKRLPSLKLFDEVNLGTANGLNGSFFPMGVVVPTAGGVRAANNYDLASGNIALSLLEWNIYTFGYYNAQTKLAKTEFVTSQANYTKEKYLVTSNVVSLYLDWLKKYRLLQIELENIDREETILTAIRATVLSGLKPGVDSSTASAEYTKSKIAYLQALDDYTNDQISLATVTGLDTTAVQPDTSIFSNGVFNKMLLMQTSDSIVVAQPLLDVYQKRYEQQLANNKAIAKKYLPKISLDAAGWMRGSSISPTDVYANDLSEGLAYNRYNYLTGLAITYNIFDLKQRHDELIEGKYQANAQKHAMETEQLNLNAALQQANVTYNSTKEKLQELPVQLHSSQQAYDQQIALYKAGLGTLIDVTNALYVLRQAEADYVLAQDEMLQVLYIKAGLSNELDLFLQNFKQ